MLGSVHAAAGRCGAERHTEQRSAGPLSSLSMASPGECGFNQCLHAVHHRLPVRNLPAVLGSGKAAAGGEEHYAEQSVGRAAAMRKPLRGAAAAGVLRCCNAVIVSHVIRDLPAALAGGPTLLAAVQRIVLLSMARLLPCLAAGCSGQLLERACLRSCLVASSCL